MDNYYPENLWMVLNGMINELNKERHVKTVREWLQDYKDGKFEETTFETQINAGWSGWHKDCTADLLQEKLKRIAKIILEMNNKELLDNYTIKLFNRYPINSKRYDEAFFVPFNLEKDKPLSLKLYEDGECVFE